jgi:hypothetical protein
MATKLCTGCMQNKSISDFYKANHYNREDSLDYYCKFCRIAANLQSQRTNTKTCSFEFCDSPHYAKTYCRKHYARLMRNGTTERQNEPVDIIGLMKTEQLKELSNKKSYLLNTYKMTLEDYIERASKGCEICGRLSAENLHVDHDHNCCNTPKSCGVCVRGVICNRCNTAVDKYENNLLRRDYPNYNLIKEYVKKYA